MGMAARIIIDAPANKNNINPTQSSRLLRHELKLIEFRGESAWRIHPFQNLPRDLTGQRHSFSLS
jgi:hypothetical protein